MPAGPAVMWPPCTAGQERVLQTHHGLDPLQSQAKLQLILQCHESYPKVSAVVNAFSPPQLARLLECREDGTAPRRFQPGARLPRTPWRPERPPLCRHCDIRRLHKRGKVSRWLAPVCAMGRGCTLQALTVRWRPMHRFEGLD
jgi:hypothetical protein